MLTQRTFLDDRRSMGHPNLRHFEYGHNFSDEDLIDIAADTLVDPVGDTDEEEFRSADHTPHYDSDSLPSTKLAELDSRCSLYDRRNPDVSDSDWDDTYTDLELYDYYYGWKNRRHWKSTPDHPFVLKEDVVGAFGGLLPLVCDYETAAWEDHRINKMIFEELQLGGRHYMTEAEFKKWMASLGDEKTSTTKLSDYHYEEPDNRMTYEAAKEFIREAAHNDHELRTIINRLVPGELASQMPGIYSPRSTKKKPTRCWELIARAASAQGWFRDPYDKSLVHYDVERNAFDANIPLNDTVVWTENEAELLDFYTCKPLKWNRVDTHRYLKIPKALDCVPKMERPLERKFLETEHCYRNNDVWKTYTPLRAA